MPRFRVHTTEQQHTVTADTPAQAAAIVRKSNPGVIIRKVKRDKSDNVSPRQAVKVHKSELVSQIGGSGSTVVMNELESLIACGAITEYKIGVGKYIVNRLIIDGKEQ